MTRSRTSELGAQAALEFALILPIAVVLLGFAVDVTGIWNAQSRVEAAAAECARAFSADPGLTEDDLAAIAENASGLGPDARIDLSLRDASPKDIVMRSAGASQPARYRRRIATFTVTYPARTMILATAAALGASADGTVELNGSCSAVISELEAS